MSAPAPSTPAPTATRPILGAAVMLCALAMLPGMDAIAKYLAQHQGFSPLQVVWSRFLFYLLAIAPFAFARFGRAALRPQRPGLQLLRGVLFASSAFAFFLSIATLPLADTMAVFFIYPLVVLLASALLLKERIGPLRWSMVALGFAGALLVIRPSASGISLGALFALLSGCGYALGSMVTRRLADQDAGLVTSLLSALTGLLMFSLAVPFVWRSPGLEEWLWMALLGGIAAAGHFLLITAHRLATAAQLAPYGYAEIVSAVCFGLVVFGDWPQPVVWLGIAVIVVSGIVVTWSNARLDRNAGDRNAGDRNAVGN
jgi:drug/metabolite transporter (DMT)-like permease